MAHLDPRSISHSRTGFLVRALLLAAAALLLPGLAGPVQAQNRYDGTEPREKFQMRFGGFRQDNIDSTVRVDSKILGIGTVINLEDSLDVDSEITVFRLDGFYRFNARHRIDWTVYETTRKGSATTLEDIQIGDNIFLTGATIQTELNTTLVKLGYSWSFINVRKYEFYLGGGLNFRDSSASFIGQTGMVTQVEEEDALIPLPVFNFGGRYNITEKTQLNFRSEIFDVEIGDFQGRFQESFLFLEHNTFKNFGFGGGITSYLVKLELDDDDWRGEFETSYNGAIVYIKWFF